MSLYRQTQADTRSVFPQEPTVPGKECRRCNVFKQATDFYRNKTNPDGLYNNCKACFASDAWNRCMSTCCLDHHMVTRCYSEYAVRSCGIADCTGRGGG